MFNQKIIFIIHLINEFLKSVHGPWLDINQSKVI